MYSTMSHFQWDCADIGRKSTCASVFSCDLGAVFGGCPLHLSVWQTAVPWSWWWRWQSRLSCPEGGSQTPRRVCWIPDQEGRKGRSHDSVSHSQVWCGWPRNKSDQNVITLSCVCVCVCVRGRERRYNILEPLPLLVVCGGVVFASQDIH